MDTVGYHGTIRDKAQYILTNWSWKHSVTTGPLGEGIYFYTSVPEDDRPDTAYLKQLSNVDYRLRFCVVRALIMDNNTNRLLDLDPAHRASQLETIKQHIIEKYDVTSKYRLQLLDDDKLEQVAIKLLCKQLSASSVKKTKAFKSLNTANQLSEKVFIHICVFDEECINKPSIELLREEGGI